MELKDHFTPILMLSDSISAIFSNQSRWIKQTFPLNYKCILKADKSLNRNGTIKFCHFAPFLMPFGCHIFQPISTAYANLVDGHLMNICTKLSWNLTSGFREDSVNSLGTVLLSCCRSNKL